MAIQIPKTRLCLKWKEVSSPVSRIKIYFINKKGSSENIFKTLDHLVTSPRNFRISIQLKILKLYIAKTLIAQVDHKIGGLCLHILH